jgi:DNA polymerase-1
VPLAELEQVQPLIKAEMEGVANLRVPLTVEVGSGQSWAGAH